MPFEDPEVSWKFLTEASYLGTITSADGYQSSVLPQMPYSTLNVNAKCDGNITLQIFSFANMENTTAGYTNGKLVFEKKITANNHYFKRFAVWGMYSQIKIINITKISL